MNIGGFAMNEYLYPIIGQESSLPLFVNGIGGCDWQYHVIRDEGFPHNQINFCVGGCGKLFVDGKEYTIEPKTSFFLPPHVPHEYYTVDDIWVNHWITFDGEYVDELMKNLGFNKPFVVYHDDTTKFEYLWSKMLRSIKDDKIYGGCYASGFLYEYLIEYYRIHNRNEVINLHERANTYLQIIEYIELNYSKDITLKMLANLVQVSEQHLCKIFKEQFQMRPFEYITRFRIQKAKQLLTDRSLSVQEVAAMVGFHDCSYFCRIFKESEKITPRAFSHIY